MGIGRQMIGHFGFRARGDAAGARGGGVEKRQGLGQRPQFLPWKVERSTRRSDPR